MAPRPTQAIEADYVIVVGGPTELDDGSAVRAAPMPPLTPTGGAVVVAADSGLEHARAWGLRPHHLVGDLDSACPEAVAAAEAEGTEIHRHPTDKDATDFELAIDLVSALASVALHAGPETGDRRGGGAVRSVLRVLVLGPGGGRFDHLLADVLLLASAKLAACEVTAAFGPAVVLVARPGRPCQLPVAAGAQVSLLGLHGAVRGVTTTGLRWPLTDADLAAGTSRGVSNEAVGPVSVTIADGVLTVVMPGTDGPAVAPRTTPYDPTPRSPR